MPNVSSISSAFEWCTHCADYHSGKVMASNSSGSCPGNCTPEFTRNSVNTEWAETTIDEPSVSEGWVGHHDKVGVSCDTA